MTTLSRDAVARILRDHTWSAEHKRCTCGDRVEYLSHHQADLIMQSARPENEVKAEALKAVHAEIMHESKQTSASSSFVSGMEFAAILIRKAWTELTS